MLKSNEIIKEDGDITLLNSRMTIFFRSINQL